MALEIAPKQLHRHATFIGVLVLAISLLSIGITAISGSSAGIALTSQVMHVHTGPNGVARISFDNEESVLGPSSASVGQSTNHSLILQSAAKQFPDN